MKTFSPILIALIILAATTGAFAEPPSLETKLEAVGPAHPRLFFTEAGADALEANLAADPLLAQLNAYVLASADEIHGLEPLKREKVGRRLLGVSRACLQRVSYLAYAYRMTKDAAYLKTAEREMLAVAAFDDWNPSHYLDVAEMTAALAIGYDWLYNDLSPETRLAVRDAIIEKGLKTSLEPMSWQKSANNWNQVCHGGMVLGSLAVLEDAPELAHQLIARAIENVPIAMAEYEPDGVYPEGPTYWSYGTTFNVLLISALESVLGSDFGLADAQGFLESPEFYLHATGPTGQFFNFSDCGIRGSVSPAMHWFANRLEDPSLLWHERPLLEEFVAQKAPNGGSGGDRVLPFLLVWGKPMSETAPPQQLHWHGDGRTPVAMHRSGWSSDATFVGIKGGAPFTNHAHMDIGSFVLDMDGVRWAVDLGAQDYNSLESAGIDLWNKEQGSERWTVFRLSSLSHNTLVVNGQLQRVHGDAPITRFSDDPGAPLTIVNMTPVYEGQLARAQRGIRLVGEAVVVQDEIVALEQDATVRWGMATTADVSISEPNKAVLEKDGQTLSFEVLSPKDARLEVYDLETPPHDYDAPNPNTRMIGFEIQMAPSAEETITVFMRAGSDDAEPLAQTALKDW